MPPRPPLIRQPLPNPIIHILPGHPIFSIDVECVATGVQHDSRSIAQVSVVDEWSRSVFNAYVKQTVPVLSYITPLTGLTAATLDTYGISLGQLYNNNNH